MYVYIYVCVVGVQIHVLVYFTMYVVCIYAYYTTRPIVVHPYAFDFIRIFKFTTYLYIYRYILLHSCFIVDILCFSIEAEAM